MSRFRLHAASWFGLLAACFLLVVVTGGVDNVESWDGYFGVLPLDILFSGFVLVGTVAALEIWCRAHGPLRLTLPVLFGAVSAICLCFSGSIDSGYSFPIYLWLQLHEICHALLFITFGVAVFGWIKMIGQACQRR